MHSHKNTCKSKLKSGIFSFVQDFIYALVAVLILFSILYLILGPPFPPIVVVISTSMLHEDTEWKTWFEKNNLNYTNFPFIEGFDKGDVIITKRADKINVGDVIIYERDIAYGLESIPIIHRVVGIITIKDWKFESYTGALDCVNEERIKKAIEEVKICNKIKTKTDLKAGLCPYKNFPKEGNFKFYITKGDNNPVSDQCGFMRLVPETQVITNAWILIPKIGYIKIWLNEIISYITSPFRG